MGIVEGLWNVCATVTVFQSAPSSVFVFSVFQCSVSSFSCLLICFQIWILFMYYWVIFRSYSGWVLSVSEVICRSVSVFWFCGQTRTYSNSALLSMLSLLFVIWNWLIELSLLPACSSQIARWLHCSVLRFLHSFLLEKFLIILDATGRPMKMTLLSMLFCVIGSFHAAVNPLWG